MYAYSNINTFKLLMVFLALIIVLPSCTGPYSVPKKEEGDKDTRVIFDESIEKEGLDTWKEGKGEERIGTLSKILNIITR